MDDSDRLVTDIESLAREDGRDLDDLSTCEFARRLEDWVLAGRLALPVGHPFRDGLFVVDSDVEPREILRRAEEEFEERRRGARRPDEGASVAGVQTADDFMDRPSRTRGELAPEVWDGRSPGPDEEDDETPPRLYGEELEVRPGRTIILVPGILGSKIKLITPRGDDDPDDIKQVWPPVVVGDGNVASIDKLADDRDDSSSERRQPTVLREAYDMLISRLENDCRTSKNCRLFLFGYDWTKSNNLNGSILADVVRVFAGSDEENTVDVVAHSMGGIVTRSAIRIHGAPVRKTVYVASPHYGAPKAYFALHPEVPVKLAETWWKRLIIQKLWESYADEVQPKGDLAEILKTLAKRFPSVYEVLPDEFYFATQYVVDKSTDSIFSRDQIAPVTTLNGTYYDEPASIGFDVGVQEALVTPAMEFKRRLDSTLPGDHLTLYNDRVSTDDRIVYDIGFGLRTAAFTDPKDSGQHGDGTVPRDSARVGNVKLVSGSHVAIPNNDDAYRLIHAYLEL